MEHIHNFRSKVDILCCFHPIFMRRTYTETVMVHRGSRPREARFLSPRSVSTPDEKFRRHRNKKRIWRRAVRRIEAAMMYETARTIEVRADALPA